MTSDDHEGQQRPGVPRGGPARRGAHTRKGEDEQGAAQVFYVAATRATQRLIGVGGARSLGKGCRLDIDKCVIARLDAADVVPLADGRT